MPEVFGPYLVHEPLGSGGMATVHRAERDGAVVALKRLQGQVAGDETFVRGFIREARLAAQLQHRNIAQIYDLGRVDEVYYIALELVSGYDLRQILRQLAGTVGPLPVALALNILGQVCDALDCAHNLRDSTGRKLGLVHRDISPANLLLGGGGVMKVIDFGIAKAASNTLHTATGILKGKFSYIAPEYLQTGNFDARSDLFGLGVVGYELLTAKALFKGADDYETLEQVRYRDVPPPSTLNPEVPHDVDAVILTALAKDPARRWQSAAQMRQAIDAARARPEAHATDATVHQWVAWAMSQRGQRPAMPVADGESVMIEADPGTILGPAPVAGDERAREVVTFGTAPQAPGTPHKATLHGWAGPMPAGGRPPTAPPGPMAKASSEYEAPPTPAPTRPPVGNKSVLPTLIGVLILCAVVGVGVFLLMGVLAG